MKNPGQDFFHFTRNERRGLYVLSLLIFLSMLANVYVSRFYAPNLPAHPGFEEKHALLDSILQFEEQRDSVFLASSEKIGVNQISAHQLQLLGIKKPLSNGFVRYRNAIGGFKNKEQLWRLREMDTTSFDAITSRVTFPERDKPKTHPNHQEEGEDWRTRPVFSFSIEHISDEQIKRLPVPESYAKSWINYRKNGGKVQRPEDLYKLFHADSAFINPLIPHITNIPEREPERTAIDLNKADSIALTKVRGIGPVYASRILKRRESLGGFVDIYQLTEVYGIDSNVVAGFQKQLALSGDGVKKLEVNTATVKQLGMHPYISWELAREIVKFRENIRPFEHVEELEKLQNITPDKFRKIAPYIYVGNEIE